MEQKNIEIAMRRYRLDNKLSQSDMADKLSISQQQYSAIERGYQEPTTAFIKSYKAITGINLLSFNEEEKDEVSRLKRELREKSAMIRNLMDENQFLRGIISRGWVKVDDASKAKIGVKVKS